MLTDFSREMKGSSINFGVGVYRQFRIGKNAFILPSFDVVGSLTKVTVTNYQSMPEDNKDAFLSYYVSLTIVFNLQPQENMLVFTPEVGFGNETTVFGIAIGLVFPFNKIATLEFLLYPFASFVAWDNTI